MTKITSLLITVASVAMFAACNSTGYKTTPSGIRYRIISSGNAPLVKRGEILKLHYQQKLNDSVMFTSFNSTPTYAKVDSVGKIYNPVEVLPLLHKGDSVIIVQLADSLLKTMPPGSQSTLKKGDKITLILKVLDVLKTDEMAQADQANEFKSQIERESSTIQKYLSDKKIQTQKTTKGVFVAMQLPGDGPVIDSGKYVSVKYTGQTFAGKVFDSNVDPAFNHTDTLRMVVGTRGSIEGFDDGLRLFKKGGKGRIFIPSTLGYGATGAGADIKPFENLIFDIEVVDVADAAPPQKQQFPMPQQQQDPRMQNQQNQQNPNGPNQGQ